MKSKLLTLSAILAVMAVVGFFLQQSQAALFQYREQQQIFLMDADYIAGWLKQIGGFATVAAQYLVQFFANTWAGAVVSSFLITLTGCFLWLVVRHINTQIIWVPFAIFPAFLQMVYLLDMGYHYEGLIAWLLFAIFLYLYQWIADKAGLVLRTLIGIVITLLLFVYVGSIATLFAICACIYDLLRNPRKSWVSLAYLAVCFLAAAITVTQGKVIGFEYALWTRGYYEYHIELGLWQSLAWINVPIIMLIAGMVKHINLKSVQQAVICLALVLLGGYFIYFESERNTNKDFRTLAELMNAINHENWDEIITYPNLNTGNYLHLNCLNLALSHKGKTMTDLFRVPQKGAQSLLAGYQAYNDVNVLFSHIYYHTGIISESLCLSFGTMIATPNGNPSMLKLLVKERLILGDYDIAEKYITRLERTHSYRDWATSMRRFLYNDAAVEQDPELGVKRRDLPVDDHRFVVVDGVMADLMKVIGTNAQQTSAWEYALAMLMLEKNMAGIKQIVELPGFSPDIWNGTLPPLVQEAIVTYAENDADYCTAHGVTPETMQRFQTFRDLALDARRNNRNQQTALAQFRGSFWYFYMFT